MNNFYFQLKDYTICLIEMTPQSVYEGMASICCLGLVSFVVWKGWKKGLRYSAALLLLNYIFLLFCSTVFYRTTADYKKFDFTPFWSYKAIEEGADNLILENVVNVMMFLPIGLLLEIGFAKWSWWKVIGIGCLLSVSIEAMQFVFKRGFCEVDDVIHNTIGCILGYILVKGSWSMVHGFRKRWKQL